MKMHWIEKVRELSPAALTVMAQALDPTDRDLLLWQIFFPRQNVGSTRLSQITNLDFRPVADNREWDGKGRQIPLRTPATRELKMVPTEAYFKIGEEELQELNNQSAGNREVITSLIKASVPDRVQTLVTADYRRLEVNAFSAWATGKATTSSPKGTLHEVSFGFDAGRYQTAATAWDDGGLNAYDEFLAWCEDAISSTGGIRGAVMRIATLKAIQENAPNAQSLNGDVRPTRRQLQERLSDELGSPFTIVTEERTVDLFTGVGEATVRQKLWPVGKVAAVPSGGTVGATYFAPVARAQEIATEIPEAGIDVNGATVYYDFENGGRTLVVEAQLNVMPVPFEANTFVIDAGV